MLKRTTDLLRKINIILNIGIVFIVLSLVFVLKDSLFSEILVPILVFLQILAIILNYIYQKYVEKIIFGNGKKELLKAADPDKYKNTIQGAREELRLGLEILMSVSVTVCLIWVSSTHNILIPAGCLCLLCIAFIYADYIPHAYSYAKKYDSIFINNWMDSSYIKGLARIYLEEYEATGFRRNCPRYNDLSIYDYDENDVQQEECIRNILRMGLDSSKNYGLVFSIVLTAFNIMFIKPDAVDLIALQLVENVEIGKEKIFYLLLLAVNIVFAAINLLSFSDYKAECEREKYLIMLLTKGDKKARFDEYKKNFENNRTIRARGIFVLCSTYIDQKKSLDLVDLQYRMLFIHRLDANLSRFWSTVVLGGMALLCFLIHFHFSWRLIGILFAVLFVVAVFFRFWILEKVGKMGIIKQCKELLSSNENSEKNKISAEEKFVSPDKLIQIPPKLQRKPDKKHCVNIPPKSTSSGKSLTKKKSGSKLDCNKKPRKRGKK